MSIRLEKRTCMLGLIVTVITAAIVVTHDEKGHDSGGEKADGRHLHPA